MSSILNLPGLKQFMDGSDSWVGSVIKARLLMTNTTAGSENNVSFLDNYITIDSFDGSGASSPDVLGQISTVLQAYNIVVLAADNVAFGALGNGTRSIRGVLLYIFNTNDTDSIPFVFIQFSSDVTPNGATVTLDWDDSGIVQFV